MKEAIPTLASGHVTTEDTFVGPIPVDDILRLPAEERLRLAELIWDSLHDDLHDDPDLLHLSDEQLAELDRRLEEYRADPSIAVDAEEVISRVRRAL